MNRKGLWLLISLTMILMIIMSACQPQPEIVEKEVVVTEIVETVSEVEVPVDKSVLIYNSYMSDPDPRVADADAVQIFQEAHPDYEIVHSTVEDRWVFRGSSH